MADKKHELVLVEAISVFRMRYMVEINNGSVVDAIEKVKQGKAKEFSQEHVDEIVISNRKVSLRDALDLCDQDNQYCKDWTKSKKIEVFFTKVGEEANND